MSKKVPSIRNNNNNSSSGNNGSSGSGSNNKPVRSKNRVLIMQGGGALGAYEAGAFRAFYDWLSMQPSSEDENMFDVIAGTSIGAINASILISYVKGKRNVGSSPRASWEGAANRLEEFWTTKVSTTPLLSDSLVSGLWFGDILRNFYPSVASAEAARRYYAAKASILQGSPGVFSSVVPIYDFKYLDIYNTSFRSSNEPLKRTLRDYVAFPIKTSVEKNEPRLLTITTDIATAQAVVFDSYSDKSPITSPSSSSPSSTTADELAKEQAGINSNKKTEGEVRKQEQGQGQELELEKRYQQQLALLPSQAQQQQQQQQESWPPQYIKYEKGLEAEHVLASASVPINFDYQWLPYEYDYENPSNNVYSPALEKKFRAFWDGGIMSNTPLWEFLISHRAFWIERIVKDEPAKLEKYLWLKPEEAIRGRSISHTELVPNVDVYMINVWPTEIDLNHLPRDYDLTQARQDDIVFGDKTQNDQQMAETITDFANLAKEIRHRALEWATTITSGDPKQEQKIKELESTIDDILDKDCNPQRLSESRLRYRDLILGQFDVEKVHRVERKADPNAIFNAMLDFSVDTVQRLLKEGRDDALRHIIDYQIDTLKHFVDLRQNRQIKRLKAESDKAEKDEKSSLVVDFQAIEAELLNILQQASAKIREDSRDPSYYENTISVLKSYVEQRHKYIERLELLAGFDGNDGGDAKNNNDGGGSSPTAAAGLTLGKDSTVHFALYRDGVAILRD
jgi:NTE family protein